MTTPKPDLRLVRPPRVFEQKSIDFMIAKLAESGLMPEDIDAYPVALGPSGEGGFLIPYHNPDMYRIRYDRKENKYKQPKTLIEAWWAPKHDISSFSDHSDIYIIEGELKAAAFVKKFGKPTFGIGGCWNFRDKTGTTPRLLADIKQAVKKGTRVHVIFDGDIESNPNVQQAAHALSILLEDEYATSVFYKPPLGKGVDDWLVADESADISHLVIVPLTDLAESRKQLYEQLDLLMDDGKLILNEENACRLIKHHFKGTLFNDRRLGTVLDGVPTNDIDKLCDDSLSYLQRNINPRFTQAKVTTGFRMALRDFSTDLLQNMVRELKWDGVPRLATWASQYLTTDFAAYTNDWGRILITGMTLRILEPGTKFDYACVLAGPQGIGKSTFFEELATFDGNRFYSALTAISTSAGDSDRTQGIKLQRAVIVDLAEGIVFEAKKSSIDAIKQFLSQTSDEHREVYARTIKDIRRGFVFVGTTNRLDQLGDQTGSRRFLNIAVKQIKRLPYNVKIALMSEVVAQQQDILNSPWWELTVKRSDIPESMLDESNEHISGVQDFMNQRFQRADSIGELIENILDSDVPAHFKQTGQMFISANFIMSHTKQEGDFATKNLISRALSAMSSSPTAKYVLEPKRIRLPQLDADEKLQMCYIDGKINDQLMVAGFLATKKK